MDDIFKKASEWEFATYMPELHAEAAGSKLIEAVESATALMNVASEAAIRYGMKFGKYRVGTLTLLMIAGDGKYYVGTSGPYPSANMLLLVEGAPIETSRVYPKGTRLCFIHGAWVHYPWEHDLPMQDGFYMSVRRTFAGLLEQELRQLGI